MTDPRNVFPDNVYQTLTCTNNRDTVDTLRFANNSSNNIFPNPSMYYLLVTKFILPNGAYPIFMFDNSKSDYLITYKGNTKKIIVTNDDSRGALIPEDYVTSYRAPIYFIQQFLDMINNTFGGVINIVDGKFILSSSDDVYFSRKLYQMFPTMEAIYTGQLGKEYQLVLRGGNCVQEFKSLYAWSDIKFVLLISDSLPILQQGVTTNTDDNQKLKVLNEFPIIYSQSEDIDKTDWVFESNQYRPIDMNTQEAFSNITYDVRLTRKDGTIVQYYLLPGEVATITFRFAKKALFNNEYNIANESERIKQNPQYNFHKK